MILEVEAEGTGGHWVEGEGWMASLIPLRADLIRQDYRCLYLGWLRSAQAGEFDDDDEEPPVPPGLRNLTAPLRALVDFLGLDDALVAVAADASSREDAATTRDDLAAWLRQMPESQKDALLMDAAPKDSVNLQAVELLRRYADHRSISKPVGVPKTARRTVGELLLASEELERRRRTLSSGPDISINWRSARKPSGMKLPS